MHLGLLVVVIVDINFVSLLYTVGLYKSSEGIW